MNLSTRLTIAMVSLVLFTALAVGILSYRNIEAATVPTELGRLDGRAKLQATRLDAYVRGARADVLALADTPALEDIISATRNGGSDPKDRTPLADRLTRLSRSFMSQLKAKPEYDEIRLIGIANNGMELLRVERASNNGSIQMAPAGELLPRAGRTYFKAALHLRDGEVYVSPIQLNRDHGAVTANHEPVLTVTTPVYDGDKHLFGMLLINVEMEPAFAEIRRAPSSGSQMFLVNEQGDFLVHPDRAREFGFDLGKRHRLTESLPALVPITAANASYNGEMQDRDGHAVLVAAEPVRLAGGPLVTAISFSLRGATFSTFSAISQSSLIAAAFAILLALALAVVIARSLAAPMQQLAQAVSHFTGEEDVAVPQNVSGEIGTLARSFSHMAQVVRERTQALSRANADLIHAQGEVREHTEKERLYAAAVESTTDAVLTTGLNGEIFTWNPAAEKLFGYTVEEAVGRNIAIIASPYQQAEQRHILDKLANGEEFKNFETVRRAKDGTLRDISLSLSLLRNADGEAYGVSVIMRDVQERRQAEEMVRAAVESAPNAMVMVDSKNTIVLVNAEAEHIFGYSRGELIGRDEEVLVPEPARAGYRMGRQEFLKNPRRTPVSEGREIFGLRKDGSVFPIEIGLNPIMTSVGLMQLAAIVDVTERKAKEKLLAEQTDELQRSNAELEQFAYVASHDLQEPLRMVASYTELLAERYQGKLDARADKYIQYAVEGAKRMQRLVNDLLTFSRVGRVQTAKAPIDFGEVLQTVLRNFARTAKEAGGDITFDTLPVLIANENEIGQIFQNLIGNALKFRAKDKPPHIHIGARHEHNNWLFSVADNGIGIEQEYSERIFQMFQRLHDRETYEGSGIGLSIAKKIVERHGGRIWFESELDKGTTFYFTLPGRQEEKTEKAA